MAPTSRAAGRPLLPTLVAAGYGPMESTMPNAESSTSSPLHRRIALRLIPFLMLLYMVAFLDRINIGFAALTMNRDLGISGGLYGVAAGVFFLGYCACEVPANLMLRRAGARRWLASLVFTWGLVSVSTAFVKTGAEYIAMRCLLGVVEAGFFPGVIYYLTLWLPRTVRARYMALFLLSIPLCSFVASPISAHLLLLDGAGRLHGWQWLFVIEGAPAVLLGMAAWFLLADTPGDAGWLTGEQKETLALELAEVEQEQASHAIAAGRAPAPGEDSDRKLRSAGLPERVIHPLVWRVAVDSLVYFTLNSALYGLGFWLPKMLVAQGISATASGWWAAIPYGVGSAAMLVLSRAAGRARLGTLCLVSAAGFAMAGFATGFAVSLAGFSLAALGAYAALPLFWSASTARMHARAAGSAIAWVNSIGVLGGFVAPVAIGWLLDRTHAYASGLCAVAGCLFLGSLLALSGNRRATAGAF